MYDEEYNKYDAEVEDIDEIKGNDIKINSDFYIHTGILKAQEALANPDVKQGFLQYRVIIEHIEVLCKAANITTEEYETELKTFKDTEEYKKTEAELTKGVLLANKKLELLMKQVFNAKTITKNLKA